MLRIAGLGGHGAAVCYVGDGGIPMHRIPRGWRRLATGLAVLSLLAVARGRDTPPAPRPHLRLTTSPSPPRVGRPVRFVLTVTSPNGRPLAGASAHLDLTMASMDMGTIPVPLREKSPGRYVGRATIPMGGEWNCRAVFQLHSRRSEHTFHLRVD